MALTPERQSTRAWSSGAIGEERVAAALDGIASQSIRVLHDRKIPSSNANIDHLVVTPGGVWVIDSKRYQDRRPELRVEGGILRPRVEKLLVRGSDKTALVEGVLKQVACRRRRCAMWRRRWRRWRGGFGRREGACRVDKRKQRVPLLALRPLNANMHGARRAALSGVGGNIMTRRRDWDVDITSLDTLVIGSFDPRL